MWPIWTAAAVIISGAQHLTGQGLGLTHQARQLTNPIRQLRILHITSQGLKLCQPGSDVR